MFNHVPNKENYSFFSDSNYLVESDKDNISSLPANLWYLIDKVEIYVSGNVEIIGGRFSKPSEPNVSKHVGEYVDGSATIEFREKKGDPILQYEGVLNNGDVVNYESSNALRLGYGSLNTGTNFSTYDKSPAVNKWLARSWINGGAEELLFLVESKQMIDDVASHYSLPVPYDSNLATVLSNDLQSIRLRSVDLNHAGEGNWVAVVVASIVFVGNVATKFRLYKTSRE
jgi:hypothetical protein